MRLVSPSKRPAVNSPPSPQSVLPICMSAMAPWKSLFPSGVMWGMTKLAVISTKGS